MLVTTPKTLLPDAVDNIKNRIQSEVKTSNPQLAGIQMHRIANEVVDGIAETQVYSPLDKAGMVAQGLKEASTGLGSAEAANQVLESVDMAAKQATQKKELIETFFKTLDAYATEGKPDAGNASSQDMANAFALLSGLGPIMGLDVHDFHYAMAIGNTARGESDGKQTIDGQEIHLRRTHLPAKEALELAQIKDDKGKANDALLNKIAADTGAGIYAAMQGLVYATEGSLLDKEHFSGKELKALPDPILEAPGNLGAWEQVNQRLKRIGYELAQIQKAANTGKEDVIRQALQDNPYGKSALEGAQAGWVKLDQNKENPRFVDGSDHAPRHFDDLTPSTAVRNLPVVVGMIEGLPRSDEHHQWVQRRRRSDGGGQAQH